MHQIFCHCELNLLTALAKTTKNLFTDARLSPDLRTQIHFGRLKNPSFGKLATPGVVLDNRQSKVSLNAREKPKLLV